MATILIIDDSEFQRDIIKNVGEHGGYEILEAVNAAKGLDMVADYQPDCISLDLVLPDMSGLEVLRTLHNQGSEIPVVVVTADIQLSVRRECEKLGAAAIIHKPFEVGKLLQAFHDAIE